MVVRECSQNLLATDAALLLPVSATDFGDPAGAPFGLTVDGGAIAPFHRAGNVAAVREIADELSSIAASLEIELDDETTRLVTGMLAN